MFLVEDNNLIYSIPLPLLPCNDKLVWYYDKFGEDSVRSGYRLAFNQRFRDQCEIIALWTALAIVQDMHFRIDLDGVG
ncbi:hypothetical protein ACOSQ4_021579 [Xanthoceras sorbifolium]